VIGAGGGLLARIVQLVVSVVVLIIIAGILLVLLKANPTNTGQGLREERGRQGRRHPHRPKQTQALKARMRKSTQLRLGRR
jgi:hypothetical protein